MALTLTVTTPLTADDRNVLSALLGQSGQEIIAPTIPGGNSPLATAVDQGKGLDPASETEPDAGAPESGEGLDADGLPWDEAIHSSNKKKTAAGVWMRRRGVQDAVFDARVAELRQEQSGADVFAQQVEAAAQTLVPPPPPAAAAEVPPPPAPAPAAPAPEGNEWDGQPGFLKIMKLVTAKKLPAEKLNELLVSVGLAPTTTSLLKADADTRAAFAALLEGTE